ncbi:MAG: hemopexin repeat-containing protein [Pseudomonadales bacterium]
MSTNILYFNDAFGDPLGEASRVAVSHITDSNRMYFFKGSQYYRFNWSENTVDPNYPTSISSGWPGVPNDIDAAVNHPISSNITYFFKGSQYYRFNWEKNKVEDGYPANISNNWLGVPDDLDAVILHPSSDNVLYFFKGDQYYRYNWTKDKVESGYPSSISSGWLGVPDNIDGAVAHPTDSKLICFIKASQIYRYSWSQEKVIEPTRFLMKSRSEPKKFLTLDSLTSPSFIPKQRESTRSQQYLLLPTLDEHYIIINSSSPNTLEGSLLEVEIGITTLRWNSNRTRLDIQLWKIGEIDNGYRRIVNKATGQAICIDNGGIKMKAVTENDYNQEWYLIPVASNYTYYDFLKDNEDLQLSLIVPNMDRRILDVDIEQLPSLAGVPARPETDDNVMQALVLAATVFAVIVATVTTAGIATGAVAVGLTVGAGVLTTGGNAAWLFWPTDSDAQWEAIEALYKNQLNATRFAIAKNKFDTAKVNFDNDVGQLRETLDDLMEGSASSLDINTASRELEDLHDALIAMPIELDKICGNITDNTQLGDLKAVMGLYVKYMLIHSRTLFAMRLVSDEYNGSAINNEVYDEAQRIHTFLDRARDLVIKMIKKSQEIEVQRYTMEFDYMAQMEGVTAYKINLDGERISTHLDKAAAENGLKLIQKERAGIFHAENEVYRLLFNGVRKSLLNLGVDLATPVASVIEQDTKSEVLLS